MATIDANALRNRNPSRVPKGHEAVNLPETTGKHATSTMPKGHKVAHPVETAAKQACMIYSACRFVKKKDSNPVKNIPKL